MTDDFAADCQRLRELVVRLHTALAPGSGANYGGKVSGSSHTPIGVNPGVFDLLVDIEAGSLDAELRLRDALGHNYRRGTAPVDVDESLKALPSLVDIAPDYLSDAVQRNVESWVRAAESTLGLVKRLIRLGPCPVVADDGEACGGTLLADPEASSGVVWCSACRSAWTQDRWLLLGDVLEGEAS